MILTKIKLTNFRSHKSFETELNPKATIIVGPNASGKTNILEAAHMLSTAKSFKAKYDRDVVKHDKDFARVEGWICETSPETTELELFIQKNPDFENASIKKTKINKVPKSIQKFAGQLKTVIFSPEDIEVLTGSPAARRRYLDNVLYQISSDYKKNHTDYILAIRQRNKVLEKIRETGRGKEELGYWNTKIVQNGTLIQNHREELISFLAKKLISYGIDLNNAETKLTLKYIKSDITFERLHEYQERELAAKNTLIGPHRDDFEIILNDFDISEFGSRGQQRSAILALKLAEIDYFVERLGQKPLLLLDDVFSELDERHEEAVLKAVKSHQTIITTTEMQKALESGYELINITPQYA